MVNLHQLTQSSTLLYNAFQEQETAVAITNADKILVYVNDAFLKMIGYRMHEVIGRKPSFLQGELTTSESKKLIRVKLQAKQPFESDVINYRKNGEAYICHIAISPIYHLGKLTHFIAYENDIDTIAPALPKDFQYDYIKRIKAYFTNEEIYSNPTLKVADISKALDIPERCVCATIKVFENKSVNQFINEYRLDLAISRIKDPKYTSYTKEHIYQSCGFNSKSVFYNVLKKRNSSI